MQTCKRDYHILIRTKFYKDYFHILNVYINLIPCHEKGLQVSLICSYNAHKSCHFSEVNQLVLFLSKLNLEFRLFVWIKEPQVFLIIRSLQISIKHGKHVCFYRPVRCLWSPSLDMPNQIRVVSACIFKTCCRSPFRGPTSLGHNNFQRPPIWPSLMLSKRHKKCFGIHVRHLALQLRVQLKEHTQDKCFEYCQCS